jgi:hypothetical protein
MGVNLRPTVGRFSISVENFGPGSHDVQDGCVTAGSHRVMRFDFFSHNVGNVELNIGKPSTNPQMFYWSAAHGHYHMREFNRYTLYDQTGSLVMPGKKQGFCLADVQKDDPNAGPLKFPLSCGQNEEQGISAGWADLYNAELPCQYIAIDGVADGDYTLTSETNVLRLVVEDTYDDNIVCTGLRIVGNNPPVEIPPPIHIEPPIPSITFNDVVSGEKTVRALVFKVRSCRAVTFAVTAGPTVTVGPAGTKFELPLGGSDTLAAAHTLDERKAQIWISYTGSAAGDVAAGSVTVHCNETNQDFIFSIAANTIARPKVAVVMVLDKSGSMDSGAGDGRTRMQVLHDSAPPFVDLIAEFDGIGVVSFDDTVADLMAVQAVGPMSPFDPTRAAARQAISQHQTNPAGLTAIGSAVEHAHNLLGPVAGYDKKAIVVLTDGAETAPKYLKDVQASIDDRVFAIGLGTPQEVNPVALNALAHGTGGYVVMTGNLDQDDYFVLSKYYLQILAGVTNQQIVVDPDGYLQPGQLARIPFRLNEADAGADVILLSPMPGLIDFQIETPAGDLVDPSAVGVVPGLGYVTSDRVASYQLSLPAVTSAGPAHEGLWHALLSFGRLKIGALTHIEPTQQLGPMGLRFSVSVQTHSSLRLRAGLGQTSYEPGATLTLRAVLTEYDLPIDVGARVTAAVRMPDMSSITVHLAEGEPGIFETQLSANADGVYPVHLFAEGHTLRGPLFTREQWLTGFVWHGGDGPAPSRTSDTNLLDPRICRLIECFLDSVGSSDIAERDLKDRGVDMAALRKCLLDLCGESRTPENASTSRVARARRSSNPAQPPSRPATTRGRRT